MTAELAALIGPPQGLSYPEVVGLYLNREVITKIKARAILDAITAGMSGKLDESWFAATAYSDEQAKAEHLRHTLEANQWDQSLPL